MIGTRCWQACTNTYRWQHRYEQGENHRQGIRGGGVKEDETLVRAAQRQLAREAGYQASRLIQVSGYCIFKSKYEETTHLCETAHLCVGKELAPAEAPPGET